MIDRFIHDDLQNNMREYENGDYVLYEDYKELEAELASMHEAWEEMNTKRLRYREALEELHKEARSCVRNRGTGITLLGIIKQALEEKENG